MLQSSQNFGAAEKFAPKEKHEASQDNKNANSKQQSDFLKRKQKKNHAASGYTRNH